MLNEEHVTTAPETIDNVDKFRSAPEVPTDPVATTVELSDFRSAKYPAVPVATAVPDVIAFADAVTVPPEAVAVGNAVALNVNVTSRVPVSAPSNAGWPPVYSSRNPEFSRAVAEFTAAITVAS